MSLPDGPHASIPNHTCTHAAHTLHTPTHPHPFYTDSDTHPQCGPHTHDFHTDSEPRAPTPTQLYCILKPCMRPLTAWCRSVGKGSIRGTSTGPVSAALVVGVAVAGIAVRPSLAALGGVTPASAAAAPPAPAAAGRAAPTLAAPVPAAAAAALPGPPDQLLHPPHPPSPPRDSAPAPAVAMMKIF